MRRPHRRAHRYFSYALAMALPLILLAALLIRQDPASAPAPQRVEAGQ